MGQVLAGKYAIPIITSCIPMHFELAVARSNLSKTLMHILQISEANAPLFRSGQPHRCGAVDKAELLLLQLEFKK